MRFRDTQPTDAVAILISVTSPARFPLKGDDIPRWSARLLAYGEALCPNGGRGGMLKGHVQRPADPGDTGRLRGGGLPRLESNRPHETTGRRNVSRRLNVSGQHHYPQMNLHAPTNRALAK